MARATSDRTSSAEMIATAVGLVAERFLTDVNWRDGLETALSLIGGASDTIVTIVEGDDSAPADERTLALPISVDGETWGSAHLESARARTWDDAEVRALKGFARVLGAAIVRTRSDQQRQEAEAKYEALVANLPAVVYISELGEGGEWLYISPHIEEMVGYTPEEWKNHPGPFAQHVHPDDLAASLDSELEGKDSETLKQEYRLYDRAGTMKWIRDESKIVRDENGKALFLQGVMFDITREKEIEQQNEFMAYHDVLTGLPNRRMFEEHLALALARAERDARAVAVAFLDLDGFKDLNDTRGHAEGDELLQQLAKRLQDAVRDADLVGRQGGDEFLVLLADIELPTTEPKAVYEVARSVTDRIHEGLRQPFDLQNGPYSLTASIGVSAFPVDADSGEELLKHADAAMYRSKAEGKARTSWSSPR